MSCALHGVEHCPLCDPLPPNHPPPEPRASQFNMAVGTDGNPLPYSPDEVKRMALKAVDDGDILAVLIRLPSGDLAFNVFGPPSWELIDMLEGAVSQFKRALGLSLPKGRAS